MGFISANFKRSGKVTERKILVIRKCSMGGIENYTTIIKTKGSVNSTHIVIRNVPYQ
jgi:hypothetical protein